MQLKVLDDFLSLTDYPAFVKRMFREIEQKREQDAKAAEDKPRLRKRQDSLRREHQAVYLYIYMICRLIASILFTFVYICLQTVYQSKSFYLCICHVYYCS